MQGRASRVRCPGIGLLPSRIVRRLLAPALLVVPLAAGAAGGLAWRLAQGPLSLAAVQAPLERLVARGSPFLVDFAEPALAWSTERGTFEFAVRDLHLRTREGAFVAA